jgi:transposase-like protein
MAKRPPKRGERAVRRAAERARTKLEQDRERLFTLEPGGRPERPLEAHSAAVIETQATRVPCPRCGGSQEVTEHAALVHRGVRLREAKLRCRQCGSERSLWFRIVGPSLN